MRPYITFVIVLIHSVAMGQNWALINPAYRYNYSDDGTDTISNQIRVMEVDTLGPDSFRYELNRIGVVCDTCSAALGGLCDGCFVWVDQPQFLQHEVFVHDGEWFFTDPDTFLLKPRAPVGSTWPFHPTGNVTATMVARQEAVLWGVTDSVAMIVLSSTDTIIVSKEHGIIEYPDINSLTSYTAVGIHGPDVGVLLPAPLSYFDYQPGDVLQYAAQGAWYSGNGVFPWAFYWGTQKMAIIGRDDSANGYEAQYLAGYSYSSGPPPYAGFWMTGLSGSFTMDEDVIEERYHPVTTYPNQITSGGCGYFGTPLDGFGRTLALHGSDENGEHLISSFTRYDQSGYAHSVLASEPVPGHSLLYPLEHGTAYGTFKEGVGMIQGGENSYFEPWCQLILTGALLSGDTIGSLSDDTFLNGPLSMDGQAEVSHPDMVLSATNDHLEFAWKSLDARYDILDLNGRLMKTGMLAQTLNSIDIHSLAPGTYFFVVDHTHGRSSQRFIITR
jgi:hypothetical protein